MNRNMYERLRKLTVELTAAEHDGDVELIESIQEEIWELEDRINEESEAEYSDNHSDKNWH